MRRLAFVLLTPLLACSASVSSVDPPPPDGQPASDGGMMPQPSFQLKSQPIGINPGAEVTYCYFFHTPNTDDLSIQRWVSHMTAGVHDMIMYLTPTDQQPPGTTQLNCGVVKRNGPVWTYAAQTADAEVVMPSDDGAGNPVGQRITAGHSGFFQIHFLNSTNAVIQAQVELDAYAYPTNAQVTLAAPFVTSNLLIDIMPGSQTQPATGLVNGTCPVPLDPTGKPLQFFAMATHTYKQGTHRFVQDGAEMVFESWDWEHPGVASSPMLPFYSFTSGKLFYQCEYSNPTDHEILTGDSVTMEETCMTIGYFFPATDGAGHFCLNSAIVY